jgi:hypothetical protein
MLLPTGPLPTATLACSRFRCSAIDAALKECRRDAQANFKAATPCPTACPSSCGACSQPGSPTLAASEPQFLVLRCLPTTPAKQADDWLAATTRLTAGAHQARAVLPPRRRPQRRCAMRRPSPHTCCRRLQRRHRLHVEARSNLSYAAEPAHGGSKLAAAHRCEVCQERQHAAVMQDESASRAGQPRLEPHSTSAS